MEAVFLQSGAIRIGNDTHPSSVLNARFTFVGIERLDDFDVSQLEDGAIALSAPWSVLSQSYGHFTLGDLRKMVRSLRLSGHSKSTREEILQLMHSTSISHGQLRWIFKPRAPSFHNGFSVRPSFVVDAAASHSRSSKRRRVVLAQDEDEEEEVTARINLPMPADDDSFPPPIDDDLVYKIILEYQDAVREENLRPGVCGCCGESVREVDLRKTSVEDINFDLLQNDFVPRQLSPTSYDFECYHQAFLHADGLSNPWDFAGHIDLCSMCWRSLAQDEMPQFAIANGFYYAHECLPEAVASAFRDATFIDRRLVARCTATKICFRYLDNPESRLYRNGYDGMQRYSKGNVIIFPQDNAVLNNILPPPLSDVKDSFVAVFAGHEEITPDVLRRIGPVKANARIVRTLIDFLLKNNKAYTCATVDFPTGAVFSPSNFANLFHPSCAREATADLLFPCIQVGQANLDGDIAVESDVSGRNVFEDSVIGENDFYLEASGFSSTNPLAASYQAMKADALAHVLDQRGSFLVSRPGNRAIHDIKNEFTLTWMFPHLDPYGLGGFDDPRRVRKVSMSQQLSHMLRWRIGDFKRIRLFLSSFTASCRSGRQSGKFSFEFRKDAIKQLSNACKTLIQKFSPVWRIDYRKISGVAQTMPMRNSP